MRTLLLTTGALLLTIAVAVASDGAPDPICALATAAARGEPAPAVQPSDSAQRDALDRWLERNRESVTDVRPGPLIELPWGVSTLRPASADTLARLYLHVFEWHTSGQLVVYGLAGGVKRAALLSDPGHDLPVGTEGRSVVLTVPKQAPDAADSVVMLELDGEPRVVSLAVRPGNDGKLLLHARDAIVHGRTARYEPDPHKNTVGYWTDPADWVSWRFEITQPGKYAIEILQGCGKGSGGSAVEFRAAGQVLPVTVQDTGGFQNFVARPIGQFTFDRAGTYTLEVRPTTKPGLAVMDLRQVTLSPAGIAR